MPISLIVEFDPTKSTLKKEEVYKTLKLEIENYGISDLVFVGDTTNSYVQGNLKWITPRLLIDGCSITISCHYKNELPQYPFSRLVVVVNEIGNQIYKVNKLVGSLRENDIVLLRLSEITDIIKFLKHVKSDGVTVMYDTDININEIIKLKLHNLIPYMGDL